MCPSQNDSDHYILAHADTEAQTYFRGLEIQATGYMV